MALLLAAACAEPRGDVDSGRTDSGAAEDSGQVADGASACVDPDIVGGRWRTFVIDSIGGAPIYPDLALEPSGAPVVALRKGDASSRYAAVSRFDGQGWSTPEPVEQRPGAALGKRPSIAVSADGTWHVVSYDEDGLRPRYARKPAGGAWSVEALFDQGDDAGDHSALTLDANDRLHLVFLRYGSYDLIYGLREAGSWRFEPIATAAGPLLGSSSSLAVDEQGVVHLAYYAGQGEAQLRFARRDAEGWRDELVDPSSDSGHYPSLVLDASGEPHIAALRWDRADAQIRVASPGDEGWRVEVVDDGLGITYTTGMVALPCGGLAVAYARNEGDGPQGLWVATQAARDQAWTAVSVDSSSYVSGIDMALSAQGQLHVVYLDESNFVLRHAALP